MEDNDTYIIKEKSLQLMPFLLFIEILSYLLNLFIIIHLNIMRD